MGTSTASNAGTSSASSAGIPVFTAPLAADVTMLVPPGGPVTLTWAASGASGCTASMTGLAGWNGNTVTSPTVLNVTAVGSYAFSVTCFNNTGSANSGPVTVVVAAQVNPACAMRPAPSGLERQVTMVNRNLGGVLNQQNSEFPLNSSINITGYVPLLGDVFNSPDEVARLFLQQGKYAAFQFDTVGLAEGTTGGVSWAQVSGITEFTVHVSECPGDFEHVTDPNCMVSGVETAGPAWKVGPRPLNPGFFCWLDPNKVYFLNVVAAQQGAWTTSTCVDADCTWLVNIGAR